MSGIPRPPVRVRPNAPITLSAGVIPLHRGPTGERYLLLRAYNYWDFPKGRVEIGEEPLEAALRELAEETTLTGAELRWGEDFRETEPYGRGKIARYYVAEVPHNEVRLLANPALGMPEHHEFRWVPYAAARVLVAPRVRPILDWAEHKIHG